MLQALTKSDYLMRETFLGLKRGGWMNWAAISTVTVLLFLLGTSLTASWQLEGLLNQFGNQLEVSVYLDTGVQANELKPVVAVLPDVNQVQAITKEQAWASLSQELGLSDRALAAKQLEGNPLVDELKVKVASSQALPTVVKKLATIAGVDEVRYLDEAVQRVGQLNRGLSWVSLVVITLLTLTAIAVITTTIRLIVLARRREIEVMQLVGATSESVYLPFILQGIVFGVVGAALAWILLGGLQRFVGSLLAQQPEFVQVLAAGSQLSLWKTISLPFILTAVGAAIGTLGSLFAVRKIATR